MPRLRSTHSGWYFALVMLAGLLVAGTGGPAGAQQVPVPKMPNDGISLTDWFRSDADLRARNACRQDLPTCRDAVRQELAIERVISTWLPWVALCIVIWIAVRYVNRRERQRERIREEAARHHVRASVREKQKRATEAANREDQDGDEVDDGLGMGAPGGKRGRPH